MSKPESPVFALMRRHRIPITRENFIAISYMGSPPTEEDWSAEDEDGLPPELQDFSRFERSR
jgi:hypothetical protein